MMKLPKKNKLFYSSLVIALINLDSSSRYMTIIKFNFDWKFLYHFSTLKKNTAVTIAFSLSVCHKLHKTNIVSE